MYNSKCKNFDILIFKSSKKTSKGETIVRSKYKGCCELNNI